MERTGLVAALAVTTLGLGGLGLSAPAPDPLRSNANRQHGAASSEEQLAILERLMEGRDPLVPPKRMDPVLWESYIPAGNELTLERIALGRELYFDTRLSADGTVSCATCHDVTRAFTDQRMVSEGIGDQLGRRNAPTTLNAALLTPQFLDGRAATLEDQAGQPILNPIEMGQPDRETVVASLAALPEYQAAFRAAYGREVNYPDIERAIAAFERTLIFLDSPFDDFLDGDEDAISDAAKRGWDLFNGKARCVTCHPINHSNPLGTNFLFHNIGVSARTQDFESLARQALQALAVDDSEEELDRLAVATDLSELGRFMVTRNYADIGAFRTTQLRNIGITGPYMHDGSLTTLWDVMDHYNKGGEPNPFLDGGIEPLGLTDEEIDQVVAFMFTLTDKAFADMNADRRAQQAAHAAEKRPFRDEELALRKQIRFAGQAQ